ncbi:MAG: radical SAM protein [archaeon]|nr:radical SAM protein [archaeon]
MDKIRFNRKEQHFCLGEKKQSVSDHPLTVTLQITRKCDLHCIYCSESGHIPEPSGNRLAEMIENLNGVDRIIISGGEPTLHKDLFSVLKLCKKNFNIVAMASNAINIDLGLAKKLSGYVDYIDVTIDGPRNIHNKIRGSYDRIIRGLWNLKQAGVEFSIVAVLLEENKEHMPYIAQIADTLGAKKLKILSPIPKGRGKTIVSKRLGSEEIVELFENLKKKKESLGWNVRITMTDWEMIREGHALLIHPDGEVVASPVWTKESCVESLGNILDGPVKQIWDRYPYKKNHIKKYIEKTLMVC